MKNCMIFLLLVYTCCMTQIGFSQQGHSDQYDTRWLQIENEEISQQVAKNSRDAVALWQLWWRTVYQDKQPVYFAALKSLKNKQPENGVALAVYCAVLMESNASYGFGQFKFKVEPHEGDIDSIRKVLAKAKKLEPKLWIVYTTEGQIALFSNGNQVEGAKKYVNACREAVQLAPHISYANLKLGYALSNLAGLTDESYSEAVKFYRKAQKLKPVDAGPSFLLLNVFRYYTPNKLEAKKAEQSVLATIPPNTKLSPKSRQILESQKITPP